MTIPTFDGFADSFRCRTSLVGVLALLVMLSSGCDLFGGDPSKRKKGPPTETTVDLDNSKLQFFYYSTRVHEGATGEQSATFEKKLEETVEAVPAAHRRAVAVWSTDMPKLPRDKVYVADVTDSVDEGSVTARMRSDTWLRSQHVAIDRAESRARASYSTLSELYRRATSNPLLWRVSGGEATGTVYLFGTMHTRALESRDALPPRVRDVFERSTRFAMEANTSSLSGIEKSQVMLPRGTLLSDELGGDAWKTLVSEIGNQIPPRRLKRLQPWIAGSTLIQNLSDIETSMDRTLLKWAERDGKEIAYLESVEAGIEALRERFDTDMLRRMLEHLDRQRQQYEQLETAYRDGDAERIRELVDAGDGPLDFRPEDLRVFLTERNRSWLPKLESHLSSEGSTFVAVGVAHLVGPDHVPGMLEEKGYTVERLD